MLRLTDDNVLIRPDPPPDRTGAGILIGPAFHPDDDRETWGTVVSTGPGFRTKSGGRAPMSVVPGDRVYYPNWAGTVVQIDGQDHDIVTEGDVMGVEHHKNTDPPTGS